MNGSDKIGGGGKARIYKGNKNKQKNEGRKGPPFPRMEKQTLVFETGKMKTAVKGGKNVP